MLSIRDYVMNGLFRIFKRKLYMEKDYIRFMLKMIIKGYLVEVFYKEYRLVSISGRYGIYFILECIFLKSLIRLGWCLIFLLNIRVSFLIENCLRV